MMEKDELKLIMEKDQMLKDVSHRIDNFKQARKDTNKLISKYNVESSLEEASTSYSDKLMQLLNIFLNL